LSEIVYYTQSIESFDPAQPDLICHLNKSLYGLKQAPRLWYNRFTSYLLSFGFVESKSDTFFFIFHRGSKTIYLLLYVDDTIFTASSTEFLQRTISSLQRKFSMKDLRQLHHFLGISVQRQPIGLFLSQRQYTMEIIERLDMVDCKPCTTLVNTSSKLSGGTSDPISDPTHYHSLADVIQQVCLCMHGPREPHMTALKSILCYLHDTLDFGLLLRRSSKFDLVVYSNAD
jgi:hypothetical protein